MHFFKRKEVCLVYLMVLKPYINETTYFDPIDRGWISWIEIYSLNEMKSGEKTYIPAYATPVLAFLYPIAFKGTDKFAEHL